MNELSAIILELIYESDKDSVMENIDKILDKNTWSLLLTRRILQLPLTLAFADIFHMLWLTFFGVGSI